VGKYAVGAVVFGVVVDLEDAVFDATPSVGEGVVRGDCDTAFGDEVVEVFNRVGVVALLPLAQKKKRKEKRTHVVSVLLQLLHKRVEVRLGVRPDGVLAAVGGDAVRVNLRPVHDDGVRALVQEGVDGFGQVREGSIERVTDVFAREEGGFGQIGGCGGGGGGIEVHGCVGGYWVGGVYMSSQGLGTRSNRGVLGDGGQV
jgi:hypothetical protein